MDTSNNSVDPIDMLFEVSDGDDKAGPSAASTAKSGVYESFYDKSPLRNVGYDDDLEEVKPLRKDTRKPSTADEVKTRGGSSKVDSTLPSYSAYRAGSFPNARFSKVTMSNAAAASSSKPPDRAPSRPSLPNIKRKTDSLLGVNKASHSGNVSHGGIKVNDADEIHNPDADQAMMVISSPPPSPQPSTSKSQPKKGASKGPLRGTGTYVPPPDKSSRSTSPSAGNSAKTKRTTKNAPIPSTARTSAPRYLASSSQVEEGSTSRSKSKVGDWDSAKALSSSKRKEKMANGEDLHERLEAKRDLNYKDRPKRKNAGKNSTNPYAAAALKGKGSKRARASSEEELTEEGSDSSSLIGEDPEEEDELTTKGPRPKSKPRKTKDKVDSDDDLYAAPSSSAGRAKGKKAKMEPKSEPAPSALALLLQSSGARLQKRGEEERKEAEKLASAGPIKGGPLDKLQSVFGSSARSTANAIAGPSVGSTLVDQGTTTSFFDFSDSSSSLSSVPSDYEDDLSPRAKLCPYCSEPLPEKPTQKLKKTLARFKKKSVPMPTSTNPDGRSISITQSSVVCALHRSESVLIPAGIAKGYPRSIDWPRTIERVKEKEEELMRLIEKKDSVFWEFAKERTGEIGKGMSRSARGQFDVFEKCQPGYFGEIGQILFHQTLKAMFLRSPHPVLQSSLTDPLTPSDFIYWVLIPELAILLTQDDLSLSYKDAFDAMGDSREFGLSVFGVEEGEQAGGALMEGWDEDAVDVTGEGDDSGIQVLRKKVKETKYRNTRTSRRSGGAGADAFEALDAKAFGPAVRSAERDVKPSREERKAAARVAVPSSSQATAVGKGKGKGKRKGVEEEEQEEQAIPSSRPKPKKRLVGSSSTALPTEGPLSQPSTPSSSQFAPMSTPTIKVDPDPAKREGTSPMEVDGDLPGSSATEGREFEVDEKPAVSQKDVGPAADAGYDALDDYDFDE